MRWEAIGTGFGKGTSSIGIEAPNNSKRGNLHTIACAMGIIGPKHEMNWTGVIERYQQQRNRLYTVAERLSKIVIDLKAEVNLSDQLADRVR